MRLFFALWPDAATRAQLDEWGRVLHAVSGGRRTRAANLHLTLAFIGDIDDARLADVEHAASAVDPAPFVLNIDAPGYWKHNRIVWAGANNEPDELHSLVAQLRGGLTRAAVPFDMKGFAAHITLLREARALAPVPALDPIAWGISGFALVRSVSAAGGSAYQVHRAWPARSGAS
jgi:2'-5' RNA ligase